MTRRDREALKAYLGVRTLIRLDRTLPDADRLNGYVVGLSPRFTLLHALDMNMHLNGYMALRNRDVGRWRVLDDHDSFAERALRLRGDCPVPRPEIRLDDPGALLASASEAYPLITLHFEATDPDVCVIGRVEALTSTAAVLRKISPAARWMAETESFPFREITRVDFGGAYEDALARVAAHESLGAQIPPETWN